MLHLKRTWVSIALAIFCSPGAFPQTRTVAITVDDLPCAGGVSPCDAAAAEAINRKLLAGLRRHHAPATGFVVQQQVEELGALGPQILKEWTKGEFALGNHSYSHPDANELSAAQMEDEIVRGETDLVPLMKEAGKKPGFFRFPMNHTGDTLQKHQQLVAFLAQRAYRLATCTIDNSDYIFNEAYVRMLARHGFSVRKLRKEYLAYTSAEIDYYAGLSRQVLGYEPPEVMLLHDNRLNADVIEELLVLFERKHYTFVSLETAQSDPAYRTADTYTTPYGPMWGYRWAAERNVKVDGSLEPEPPRWIVEHAQP